MRARVAPHPLRRRGTAVDGSCELEPNQMKNAITIIDLMTDPALLGGTFGGPSWRAWRVLLAAAFALPVVVGPSPSGLARCEPRPFLERLPKELWTPPTS